MNNLIEKNNNAGKKNRQRLFGIVVSDKMKDTVVVSVNRYEKHKKYGKFINRAKRYKVHDKGNVHKIGDKVQIEQTRPISKSKTFKIVGQDSKAIN